MCPPLRHLLRKIVCVAIGRAVGGLEETLTYSDEALPLGWKSSLGPIKNRVEVRKTKVVKIICPLAERNRQAVRRTAIAEAAIVTDGKVARAEFENILGRRIVYIQRGPRRLIVFTRVAENRKVQRVVLANIPIDLARVIQTAGTRGVLTQQIEQTRILCT